MEHGGYNKLILSLSLASAVLFIETYVSFGSKIHPLNEDRLLLINLPLLFSLMFVYIIFCTVWGPRMMKDREAIKLKCVIQCYNICQVVLCCYMVYEFCMAGWLTGYSLTCEPSKYTTEPKEARMASVVYVYYLSKYLDLFDTIFFVLNKKWQHISVLHLVHHSTMVANIWGVAVFMPRGHSTFIPFVNSFVHICMYSYYFLAALGSAVKPYLWWKKYLTMLQMIQLVVTTLHMSQVLFNGCDVVPALAIPAILSSVTYLLLFLNFYLNAYKKNI